VGRSASGPPLYLTSALNAVERIVRELQPCTEQQIRDRLMTDGFEWPTRNHVGSKTDSTKVTLGKVRRVLTRLYGYRVMAIGDNQWVHIDSWKQQRKERS
jgi:hypothetical protein